MIPLDGSVLQVYMAETRALVRGVKCAAVSCVAVVLVFFQRGPAPRCAIGPRSETVGGGRAHLVHITMQVVLTHGSRDKTSSKVRQKYQKSAARSHLN